MTRLEQLRAAETASTVTSRSELDPNFVVMDRTAEAPQIQTRLEQMRDRRRGVTVAERPQSIGNAPDPGVVETVKDTFSQFRDPDYAPDTASKIDAQQHFVTDYALPLMAKTPGGSLAAYAGGHAIKNLANDAPLTEGMNLPYALRATSYGAIHGADYLGDVAKLAGAEAVAKGAENANEGLPFLKGYDPTGPAAIAALPWLGRGALHASEAFISGAAKGVPRAITEWSHVTMPEGLLAKETESGLRTIDPMEVLRWSGDPAHERAVGIGLPHDVGPPTEAAAYPTTRLGRMRERAGDLWSQITVPIGRLEQSGDTLTRSAGARLAQNALYGRELEANASTLIERQLGGMDEATRRAVNRRGQYEELVSKSSPSPADLITRMRVVATDATGDEMAAWLKRETAGFTLDERRQLSDLLSYEDVANASPEVTGAVSALRRDVLHPLDFIAQREAEATINPVTGESRLYQSAGPKFWPRIAKPAPEGVDPYVHALEQGKMDYTELGGSMVAPTKAPNTVEFGRRQGGPPANYEEDAAKVLHAYADESAARAARTSAFGSPRATTEWAEAQGNPRGIGQEGAEMLGEVRAGDRFAGHTLQGALRATYRTDTGPEQRGLDWVKRLITNAALFKSGITQIPQASSNVADAGVKATVKGLVAHATQPEVATIPRSSGARIPGVARYFEDIGRADPETWSMRMLSGVESGWNRSRSAAGFLHRINETGKTAFDELQGQVDPIQVEALLEKHPRMSRTQAAVDLGARPSAVTSRLASEVRSTAVDLAHDHETLGAALNPRRYASLVERRQFQGAPGEVPSMMHNTPAGGFLMQYRPFAARQSNMVARDILAPMVSGDQAERVLGRQRLARLVAAGVPASTAIYMLKRGISGQGMPSGGEVGAYNLSSLGGFSGDVANLAFSGLGSGSYQRGDDLLNPAGGSILGGAADTLVRQRNIPKFALKYAAPALFPNYGGAFGPLTYNALGRER